MAHRGFKPIQNRDAGLLFDAIFGRGRRVYHTGGYLGSGEVVWLLARIDKTLRIADDDVLHPYALMANSHDGSLALNIRLTTVRVVCQNTLSLAVKERIGPEFRRAHQGSFAQHAAAARDFFSATLRELDSIADAYTNLTKRECTDEKLKEILFKLIPDPKQPRNAVHNPGLMRAWEKRVAAATTARVKITELRESGRGQRLKGSQGTLWGVLNAVLEYVDHYHEVERSRLAYALLGDGMDLKMKAFRTLQDEAGKAA